jgi:hypothetical protein
VHLVNQLAVVIGLGEQEGWQASDLALVVTGVLRNDTAGLEAMHQSLEVWCAALRREWPASCAGLRLVSDPGELKARTWDVACLNNLWQRSQHEQVRQLGIATVLACGDGVGIYYRCARELRAIVPSLLKLPMEKSDWQVRFFLEGRQPLWHRPPLPSEAVPSDVRAHLFENLVATLGPAADPLVEACLIQAPPGRPLWLCSVPNLAHQFPGQQLPVAVLEGWLDQLEGFERDHDRLLLIDHPKAPPGGSFGSELPAAVAGPIRSALPLELLVRQLHRRELGRPLHVAGMSSALLGVRRLTGTQVHWLPLAPLWRANPGYRRRPQEYLHRWLRVRRMALLCRGAQAPQPESQGPAGEVS